MEFQQFYVLLLKHILMRKTLLISIFFEGSNEKGQLDFIRTDEGYQLIGVGFGR
ncbi:MAG: hypothetical protein H6Q26_1811 [Bacteroidetes bacterium]|nr:hypothetical protein [Bacteroidota bacterium]